MREKGVEFLKKKKFLKALKILNCKGQSIFEYFALFIIFAIAILIVFGSFELEKNKTKPFFDQAVDTAIKKLNE